MSKLAVTILVFRILQLGLGLAFLVFWTWSCAAKYVVGGGAGEYVFGYLTSFASLAICVHGIWSFAKKQHHAEHSAVWHNTRWAVDLVVVCLWLGVILVAILVPVPDEDQKKSLYGDIFDAPSSLLVVGMGVNVTELFSVITLFMTSLLLIIPAVKARKPKKIQESTGKGTLDEDNVVDSGLQAPQSVHLPQQAQREHSLAEGRRMEGVVSGPSIQLPQAVYTGPS